MSRTVEAYEAHEGPKVLVKYEDLRSDALDIMRGVRGALDLTVDEEQLSGTVEKHAWENIPEEEKGPGKFYRKASPGGWREDLTPEQVDDIESIAAPILDEYYGG